MLFPSPGFCEDTIQAHVHIHTRAHTCSCTHTLLTHAHLQASLRTCDSAHLQKHLSGYVQEEMALPRWWLRDLQGRVSTLLGSA